MNQLILLTLFCCICFASCGYPFEGLCKTITYNGKQINGFYEVFGDYSSDRYYLTLGLRPILYRGYLLEDILDDASLNQGLNLIIKKESQSLIFGRETYDERVNYYFKTILKVKKFDAKPNDNKDDTDNDGNIKITFSYFVPAYDNNYDSSKDKYCKDILTLPPFYSGYKHEK